jgi:hypothetical protein
MYINLVDWATQGLDTCHLLHHTWMLRYPTSDGGIGIVMHSTALGPNMYTALSAGRRLVGRIPSIRPPVGKLVVKNRNMLCLPPSLFELTVVTKHTALHWLRWSDLPLACCHVQGSK